MESEEGLCRRDGSRSAIGSAIAGAAVQVGSRLCLRPDVRCNMLTVSVFMFLYAFSFYYFPFFVLSMRLLYLSFFPSLYFPISLFRLMRIANGSRF